MNISASLNGITEIVNDLVLLIFLAVFTLVTIFVSVWFIAANINKPQKDTIGKMKTIGVVWLIVAIGTAIRVAFSLITVGYLGLSPTSGTANLGGLMELYGNTWAIINGAPMNTGNAAYPVPAYIALLFGKILDLCGGLTNAPGLAMQVVFRLPYMICDAAAALVLYKIAKKYANSFVGVGLAAIYMLCPVFFFASGIWGTHMSILSLLIMLALYFMAEKNYFGLTVAYGFALLTAPEALFFLPVFGVFYVLNFIKAIKANRSADAEKLRLKDLFMHEERGLILRIPMYLVLSLVMMYVIHLPALGDISYNLFSWIHLMYIAPLTKVKLFGTNAFSIYNLFGRNNAEINSSMPLWIISFGFFAIALALVYVLYTSKKNRANLVLVAGYVMLTLSIYFMGFKELSLLPVLATLLLAFVLVKDKRILHVFGLVALAIVLNASTVMMTTGYFSGESVSTFISSTGTALLSASTFGTVMNVICSIMVILTHLYFTVVVLDVSITGKRMLLSPANDSFGGALKSWFKIR